MKFYTLTIVMLLAGLLIPAGCRRDDPGQSRSGSPSADSVEKLNYFYPRGYTAIQSAPVYDLSGDQPEWIGAPDFWEELELNPDEIKGITNPDKAVRYQPLKTYIDDEAVFLIPILWRGRPGWISSLHYAPYSASAGVFIQQATLKDGRVLRVGELAVIEGNRLFAPVYNVHVGNIGGSLSRISVDPDDIDAGKLIARAAAARGGERSQALLREAAEKFPESALFPMIADMLNLPKRVAESETVTEIKTERLVAIFSTAAETTVYSSPDFSSPATRQIGQYSNVKTTKRTTSPETTRTGSARWYHINEPVEGWIFGLNLEGAD